MARKSLGRFLNFLKPYWPRGVIGFIFIIITTLIQLPMPFLSMYVIDYVLPEGNQSFLNTLVVFVLFILIIGFFISLLQTYVLEAFRQRVFFDIQKSLFEKILQFPISYFRHNDAGYILSRIKNDTEVTKGLMADTIIMFTKDLLTLIFGLLCIFIIHWKMAILSCLLLPPFIISITKGAGKLRELNRELQESNAQLTQEISEDITMISMIKSLVINQTILRNYVKKFRNYINTSFKLSLWSVFFGSITSFIGSIGPLIILWFGGTEIIRGNLTFGQFFAFNTFLAYLFGPTQRILNLNLGIQSALAAADRIFELLDHPVENSPPNKRSLKNFQGNIEFKNVNFSYNGSASLLKNISFSLRPGYIYGFAGKSGIGKTTILSLLLGYYKPKNGSIYLDNTDLNLLDLNSVRREIAIVPQGTLLFSTTIEDNIRYGNPDASKEDIISVAKMAGAHDFIINLKNGYATMVGSRGEKLSGGEKQRIAVARALLKNPKVLILDESLSEIDSESEAIIFKTLISLKSNRTVVVIAHRLSTISKLDKIYFLDDGRIAAQGNHQNLLECCPAYKELFSNQINSLDLIDKL